MVPAVSASWGRTFLQNKTFVLENVDFVKTFNNEKVCPKLIYRFTTCSDLLLSGITTSEKAWKSFGTFSYTVNDYV